MEIGGKFINFVEIGETFNMHHSLEWGWTPLYSTQLDTLELLVCQCSSRLRDSLVFVLTPHPECMEDDGIRRRPDIQELNLFTQKMFSLLDELKIPFKIIEVLDRQSRLKQVIEEVLKIKPQVVNTSALLTEGQTKPL